MFEPTLSDVIAIDTEGSVIHIYNDPSGGRKDNHIATAYNCQVFSEDFFDKFGKILKAYQMKHSTMPLQKVSLVLPDHAFLTDTIDIPNIGKKAMENSLELAISAVYKNKSELKYRTFSMMQNKQFATFGLVGLRKDLAAKLTDICAENHIAVQNITFAANAMTNGAFALNNKLKSSSFVLLNIRENASRLAFVNKGQTVGGYSLPFGYSILYKSILAAEDLLFDHATAELLVLNAKEKAKAKQLTMMEEEVLEDSDQEQPAAPVFGDPEDGEFETWDGKKTGRKLPKFMLRDIPTDREGFVYENFRLFVKWTLELIAANAATTNPEGVDTVYVHLPRGYEFLYDMVNAEEEENGVKFQPLLAGARFESGTPGSGDLELLGGLYVKQFNKINNF